MNEAEKVTNQNRLYWERIYNEAYIASIAALDLALEDARQRQIIEAPVATIGATFDDALQEELRAGDECGQITDRLTDYRNNPHGKTLSEMAADVVEVATAYRFDTKRLLRMSINLGHPDWTIGDEVNYITTQLVNDLITQQEAKRRYTEAVTVFAHTQE